MLRLFRKSEKPLKMSLDLKYTYDYSCQCGNIHHHFMDAPLFVNQTASGKGLTHDDQHSISGLMNAKVESKEEMLREFKCIWTSLSALYDKHPKVFADIKFGFSFKGRIGKKEIDTTVTDRDAFHAFLSEHGLVPDDLLKVQLKVNYGHSYMSGPHFTAGGDSVLVSLDDPLYAVTAIKRAIEIDHQIFPAPKGEPPVIKLKIKLEGRIGTGMVKEEFDETDALEKYLSDKLELRAATATLKH